MFIRVKYKSNFYLKFLYFNTNMLMMENINDGKFLYIHHRYHHAVDPRYNFSGIYPIIDFIFKTSSKHKTN